MWRGDKVAKDESIRWEVTDPFGRDIVLKQATYDDHVIGDHLSEDAKFRTKTESDAKKVLETPRYIVEDTEHADRMRYIDIVPVTNGKGIYLRLLMVVTDGSVIPNEVITWTPMKKIRIFEREGIYYDAKRGFTKKQQV